MRISRLQKVAFLTILISRPLSVSAQGVTELISVGFDGGQIDGNFSDASAISADGRFVAFKCDSPNIVPNDTNNISDIFVRDRQTGVTTRVNISTDGAEANSFSSYPSISGDGRFVEFQSTADNLVPGDTNGVVDVFVHDRQTGETKRVSVASDGTQADAGSVNGEISLTGRYVVFDSYATNLGGDSGGGDIFIHDLQTGTTSLVTDDSVSQRGIGEWPTVSADGRYVAYHVGLGTCDALFYNPPHVFVIDRETNTEQHVSAPFAGAADPCSKNFNASISADGRYVVFGSDASNLVPGDTNGLVDTFVVEIETGLVERVSVSSSGEQADDVCSTGRSGPSISADGRFVAMQCNASNFVPGDVPIHPDIFVRDRKRQVTEHISVSSDGYHGDASSERPRISADGRSVVFESSAENLVPNDTNYQVDLFVRERDTTIFAGGFESGTDCFWSEVGGGTGCPGLPATGLIHMTDTPNGYVSVDDEGTFTLDDGFNPPTVFEFDRFPDGVAPGNIAVITLGMIRAEEYLTLLKDVIASTPNLDITPTTIVGTDLYLVNDHIGAVGNHLVTETVEDFDISFRGMRGGVDPRP